MISFPKNWKYICEPICLSEIEKAILSVLKFLNCRNLAFSGGIDSTLMLSLMVQLFGNKEIYCYNIACSTNHPDYIYSELAARYFNVDLIHWIPNQRKMKKRREDYPGDEIVREFYRWVYFDRKVYEIIACDGVDEFNCGYYAHMKNPTEETYYDFIRKLQKEQLIPLYKNSGKVRVFLPYISNEIILLWAQIPLSEKIDTTNRKKIICELSKRNNVPKEIIERHKYGFVDAMTIKGDII